MEQADNTTARPLVSTVIPTYNRAEYLPDAIESVLTQTYEKIELVIVDDGSSTPVRQTLDEFTFHELDSVRFVRHDENKGANVARNNGIRASSGEYIAFLDDDDRWDETKISRQVQAFHNADPEVGVVYTGRRIENPRGQNDWTSTAEGNVVKDLLTGKNFGQFSSVMVRSSILDDAGLPDERFPAWQDREWFFRLAKHCHFKPIPEILTYRRTGLPDSIERNFTEKRDVAYPLFVKKHYSFARQYGLYYARSFIASLRTMLARSAARVDRYRDARRYFLSAFAANPLYRPAHAPLLASLGGKWTYKPASKMHRLLSSITADVGE